MEVQTFARTLRELPKSAYLLIATLGGLSFLSWIAVADISMPMTGTFDLSTIVLFTGIWGIGMVAMMFPSLIPMVHTIAVSTQHREDDISEKFRRFSVFLRSALFVLGYVGIWTFVGTIFYLAITTLVQAGFPASGPLGFVAGIIIILTGLYQFTRFKLNALMKCRNPLSFIMTRWKNGNSGALIMGADYGAFCTRCCWVLMAGLLTVGTMSLPLMGLFSLIIFVEKIGPFGNIISKLVGLGFLATGIVLIL